jgi:S1-C subfamily serine protease
LIGGEQVNVNLSPVEPDTLTVQSLTNRVGFACATAIDRRGYFLTAAHTLDFGQPWLVFGSKDKPRIERATIVWRGDVSKEKSDLAVLYVPVSLDYVFEWAGQSYTGDAVIQLGLDLESTNNVLQHFAGRIETFQHPKRNPTETVIRTTAPSRPGDSGGPVVTEEGRLLGIAFKGGVQLHGFVVPMWITRFTRVVRPDPDWVREIVDRDAVARAGTNTSVSESH